MRAFFKGLLIGTACICALALVWLCLVRPEITAHEAGSLKAAYTVASPEANRSGALPAGAKAPPSALDFSALQKQYPDVKAWLEIPGTEVDYPVLQGKASDPEHYLRRNYKDEYRVAGSLFFQADCAMDGRSLVIYGHNMDDGTMFGTLPKYMDKDFCTKHSMIQLELPGEKHTYQVAAVLETDAGKLAMNRTEFANDADFLSFAEGLQKASVVDTGIPITANSHLLVLITCSYSWPDARYVVVAQEEG